ncbi:MAG: MutS-related protein [Longimicrobiales bacterium]
MARYTAQRDAVARRSLHLSTARVVCFALIVAGGLWAEASPGRLPLLATALAIACFAAFVSWQSRVRRAEQWLDALAAVNRDGLNRLGRDWDALPIRDRPATSPSPAYAGDLDLYGRASIRQLLGATVTIAGELTLARWLLSPSPASAIRERQEAVRALAPRNDFRDALAAHARLSKPPGPDALERFLQWSETGNRPARLVWWLARIIPGVTFLLGGLAVAELVPWSLPLTSILAAAVLTFGTPGRRARAEMAAAFGREEIFRVYPELLTLVESEAAHSPRLSALHHALQAGGVPATEQMRRLARLAHLAGLRSGGMLYVPVQLLSLWDFHVLARLHAWRRVSGAHVREWLGLLGEAEALAALATLAHDHPDWCWPHIDSSTAGAPDTRFNATAIGHPLIGEERRVHNDLCVGPPGSFLLVTGSNMSGKSTLLRAIGVNTVLALAGAPACARELRLPDVDLRTAIHVQDSLADGVSFFMAQLQRVKEIVAAADRAREGGSTVLYLLDEILQGTNTAERRIAATRVIRHLLDAGAIGAVTTHDLELADAPELKDTFVPVHLRETVSAEDGGAALSFDYLLRPGIATSTNALRLMEIVGLAD